MEADGWQTIQEHVKEGVGGVKRRFDDEAFFNDWFYRQGRAYAILFKRHLGITDLQYAELYPLIRQYTFLVEDGKKPIEGRGKRAQNLMFHNTDDFKRTVRNIIDPFLESTPTESQLDLTALSGAYDSLLRYSVILDSRYGSCCLLVPPCLSLSLGEVCAQSGYIDSCGPQIYARSIESGSPADFVRCLSEYQKKRLENKHEGRVRFAVWAYEHFPAKPEHRGEILRDGIETLRLHQDKVRLGRQKLWPVVKSHIENDSQFKDWLHIAHANDPNQPEPAKFDGTIWLLQDRSVEYSPRIHPGNKRFLICYHQVFKNCNPLHLFDENKPAWVGPVTIPHSLLGAMVNISRPWPNRPGQTKFRVHDPFCGTGSIVLEMLKDSSVLATGGDLATETPLLLADNIEFLAATDDELRLWASTLKTIGTLIVGKATIDELVADPTSLADSDQKISRLIKTKFQRSISLLLKLKRDSREGGDVPEYKFTGEIVSELQAEALDCRLFFYVALRAELSHASAGGRGDHKWGMGFEMEAKQLAGQLDVYAQWKDREDSKSIRPYLPGTFARREAPYYMQLSVAPSVFVKAKLELEEARKNSLRGLVNTEDATDAYDHVDNSYDLVVTDPPYGFNTEESVVELALMYAKLVKVWVKKVAPKGHLVICLPEETYNGQVLPFCTSASLVTVQVLAAVADIGKKVISTAKVHPSSAPGLAPPYYWGSEKALRRVVLHFQLDNL